MHMHMCMHMYMCMHMHMQLGGSHGFFSRGVPVVFVALFFGLTSPLYSHSHRVACVC